MRHARLHAFVNNSWLQSHRDRVCLVSAGIIKLSIHHDSDWDQVRLPILRNLKHRDCSRAFADRALLGNLSVEKRGGTAKEQNYSKRTARVLEHITCDAVAALWCRPRLARRDAFAV